MPEHLNQLEQTLLDRGSRLKSRIPEPTVGEQSWRDMVNIPLPHDPATGLPPAPPAFRPEPVVVGTELARAVQRLLNIAPELRGRIKSVIQGPTNASITDMINSDLPPDEFENTNLLGITDQRPKHVGEIGISPKLDNTDPTAHAYSLDDALAHEFAHIAGFSEAGAQMAGKRFRGQPNAMKFDPDTLRNALLKRKK